MKKTRKLIIILLNIIILLFAYSSVANANDISCHLKGFNLKEDTLNFENSVNDLGVKPGQRYNITESKLNAFYNNYNISYEDQQSINTSLMNFGGMCGGMTSLVIQNYYGILDVSAYGVSSIHDLQKPSINDKVRDLVGINHIVYSGSKYRQAENNFMLKYKDDLAVECLYNYACNIGFINAPVWADFAWVSDEKKFDVFKGTGMTGHALMVYGIQTDDEPYIIDGEEYKYRLLIVDPNINYSITELKKENYIYISENLDECIIPKTGAIADGSSGFYAYNHGKLRDNDDFVFQLITNKLDVIMSLGSVEYTNKESDDMEINQWIVSRPSIDLDKTSISMQVSEKSTIGVTTKNTINEVRWSSNNPKVVSVNNNGEICALKEGKATITASVSGRSKKCKVTVKEKKDVYGTSQMVSLESNKTYTNYDFTRDGKADYFKCTADSERGYARLYLNGKYKQRIFIGKGANIYWCRISRQDTYLLATNYLYGGHDLKVYMYSGGKFKSTPGESYLNKVFSFSDFKTVQGNTLCVESSSGGYWRNPYSFKKVSDSLTVETKFTVKNNKITCKSWTSKVTGRRIFYAKNDFDTSKNMKKLNVKNGPHVKVGQEVTLNYVVLNRKTYLYQISVNGQEGWFADSELIQFS